ncbi:hypothetical protein ACQJBY_042836 [Aegilops geniculata]
MSVWVCAEKNDCLTQIPISILHPLCVRADPFLSQIWDTFGSAADTKRTFSLLSSSASAQCMCCVAHMSSNHPLHLSPPFLSLLPPTHPAPDHQPRRDSAGEGPEPGQRRRRARAAGGRSRGWRRRGGRVSAGGPRSSLGGARRSDSGAGALTDDRRAREAGRGAEPEPAGEGRGAELAGCGRGRGECWRQRDHEPVAWGRGGQTGANSQPAGAAAGRETGVRAQRRGGAGPVQDGRGCSRHGSSARSRGCRRSGRRGRRHGYGSAPTPPSRPPRCFAGAYYSASAVTPEYCSSSSDASPVSSPETASNGATDLDDIDLLGYGYSQCSPVSLQPSALPATCSMKCQGGHGKNASSHPLGAHTDPNQKADAAVHFADPNGQKANEMHVRLGRPVGVALTTCKS